MANLRRMASLGCVGHSSSNPASPTSTHLVRHSSLPNLFLCQPELGRAGALNSLKKGSVFIKKLCRSVSAPPKQLALVCRALSSSRKYADDTPDFERLVATQGGFSPSNGNVHAQPGASPFASSKQEAIVAKGVDLEKSVVYSELRESACCWEVPPRFFMPYHADTRVVEEVSTQRGAHIHRLENKSQSSSDLCMQNNGSRNDVKDRPMSLRMLKRKLSKVSPQTDSDKQRKPQEILEERCRSHELAGSQCGASRWRQSNSTMDVGDSVFSAFASLVYMLRMLQQHALSTCMQSHAISSIGATNENLDRNWVGRAYAEMLDTFVWLFQQVFSCTPKLMLLTMMLLADFTLHSVSKHVAIPVMHLGEPPAATTLLYSKASSSTINMGGVGAVSHKAAEEEQLVETKEHGHKRGFVEEILPEPGGKDGDGSGGAVRVISHGESYSDSNGDFFPTRRTSLERPTVKGLKSSLLSCHAMDIEGIGLDATTKNMLVAPVRAPVLEADDYSCFDRTDLAYQQEISMDPSNPLLLANYAQFLHVVRHDNGRAEKLYRRAVMVDACGDGEVMGRFASFLWVVKGDVVEAESAYKAAVVADPSNTYHAGCYAHFLWSSSAGQGEETSCCNTVESLGTTSEHMPSS